MSTRTADALLRYAGQYRAHLNEFRRDPTNRGRCFRLADAVSLTTRLMEREANLALNPPSPDPDGEPPPSLPGERLVDGHSLYSADWL